MRQARQRQRNAIERHKAYEEDFVKETSLLLVPAILYLFCSPLFDHVHGGDESYSAVLQTLQQAVGVAWGVFQRLVVTPHRHPAVPLVQPISLVRLAWGFRSGWSQESGENGGELWKLILQAWAANRCRWPVYHYTSIVVACLVASMGLPLAGWKLEARV